MWKERFKWVAEQGEMMDEARDLAAKQSGKPWEWSRPRVILPLFDANFIHRISTIEVIAPPSWRSGLGQATSPKGSQIATKPCMKAPYLLNPRIYNRLWTLELAPTLPRNQTIQLIILGI